MDAENHQTEIHLQQLLSAGNRISDYVSQLGEEDFTDDQKTVDAVVWNLEIISRAVKQVPQANGDEIDSVDWRKAREFSNVVTHDYFGINHEILKNIVSNKLPVLLKNVESLLNQNETPLRE